MERIFRDYTPTCFNCNNCADYAIDYNAYLANRTNTDFHLWLFNVDYRDEEGDIWKCKKCLFKCPMAFRDVKLTYFYHFQRTIPYDYWDWCCPSGYPKNEWVKLRYRVMAGEEASLTLSALRRYIKTI